MSLTCTTSLCPVFLGLLLGVVHGSAVLDVHGPDFHILPFQEDHGAACRARLGVILLSVDETVEAEYGRYLAPFEDDGVVLYHARQFKGPEIDVAFNPTFLMDPLKVLEGDEVFFELTDSLSPGVLKSNTPFLYVLMPMRTH